MRRYRFATLLTLFALLAGLVSAGRGLAEPQPVPLVLIHGLGGSPETTWVSMNAFLAEKGYVQGKTLFAIDLNANATEGDPGVLADAAFALTEIRKIMKDSGAAQVDLVGNSRGGLIVRLLAEGDTAGLVHRAVTIDAPHQGVLSPAKQDAMLQYAGLKRQALGIILPDDISAGSDTVVQISARSTRFADRRAAALAIGTTFQDGVDASLAGHDGLVPLDSQLAWPGAKTLSFKIGPTADALASMLSGGFGVAALANNIPHIVAVDQQVVLQATYDFLHDATVKASARACAPDCRDFTALTGRWSESTVRPMLPDGLSYELDEKGNRVFTPTRPMTRAEFVYALVKATGGAEALGATAFVDTRSHWSLGYVRAAVAAKLVAGLSADSFGPDQQLNRAQAATLITRVKGYALSETPSRFADARGHWAEKSIEAAAEHGIIKGDERGFRPNDPVTAEEAAVILVRAFPK